MIELLGGPVREGVLPGCDGRILVMLLFWLCLVCLPSCYPHSACQGCASHPVPWGLSKEMSFFFWEGRVAYEERHVSLTFSSYNQDNPCLKHDKALNCLNSPSGIPYTLSSWLYIPLNECLKSQSHSDKEPQTIVIQRKRTTIRRRGCKPDVDGRWSAKWHIREATIREKYLWPHSLRRYKVTKVCVNI